MAAGPGERATFIAHARKCTSSALGIVADVSALLDVNQHDQQDAVSAQAIRWRMVTHVCKLGSFDLAS